MRRMTDPKTGEVRLFNRSNRFWGRVAAWLILGLTFAIVNRRVESAAPDGVPPAQLVAFAAMPAALFSVLAELVLARPQLTVTPHQDIKIRNPIRRIRVPLDAVDKVQVGAFGIPYLVVGKTKIRVGLEQTLLDAMNDGSESLGVLRYIFESHSSKDGPDGLPASGPPTSTIAIFDRWLTMLLMGWCAYAIFFVFVH